MDVLFLFFCFKVLSSVDTISIYFKQTSNIFHFYYFIQSDKKGILTSSPLCAICSNLAFKLPAVPEPALGLSV